MRHIAIKNPDKCRSCGFCDEIACSSRYVGYSDECAGCGACCLACPHKAIEMIETPNGKSVSIKLDGEIFSVLELCCPCRWGTKAMLYYSSSGWNGY